MAKGKESAENVATGIDDIDESVPPPAAEKVSGGFDGPSWCPQLNEFSDKIKAEKLAKMGKGSSARESIAGKLAVATAWGRKLYFIDVATKGGGTVRAHLPEHASLYGILNNIDVGAYVHLTNVGRGKAKAGQNAPQLYDVVAEKGRSHSEPREDALKIIRRKDDVPEDAEGAAREAEEREAAAKA